MIDTVLISRIQFGFTVGFHILFPTLNLGLALFLTIMEFRWLKTQNPVYLSICKFWTKIFALTFGMGVVSGVVLSYELGTNFGPFINAIGGVLGPLFGFEVMSAFFLEAGFLGIMLFGWNKVKPNIHFLATFLVMLGTAISALWIMSANSWMQTPAGYNLVNGKYIVVDWIAAVLNPSFIPRFLHMVTASYVTCAFVIAGVSAWYLLQKRYIDLSKRCLAFSLVSALIVTPIQIGLGDIVGLRIYEYQPLKTAAMEGNWETMRGAPLILFAIPDPVQEKNKFEISIPKLASLFNTHKMDGELVGLKSVPAEERPIVSTVFYNFRIMVGIGILLLLTAIWGSWLTWRKTFTEHPLFLKLCVLVSPLGFLASISGWMTAESGRQPWVVYNLMKTAEGASLVPAHKVIISLALFIIVYLVVFGFYLHYLFSLIRKGPEEAEAHQEKIDVQQPFHYMSNEGAP